jgi:hypothetical protein
MENREHGTSEILEGRVANLETRLRSARVTNDEMKAFQKVASVLSGEEGSLRLDADDLIAASFVAEALGDATRSR